MNSFRPAGMSEAFSLGKSSSSEHFFIITRAYYVKLGRVKYEEKMETQEKEEQRKTKKNMKKKR